MIQTQLELQLSTIEETILTGWLWNLTGVWNWAVRKIDLDARDRVFHGAKDFQNLLANHAALGMLSQDRCGKPHRVEVRYAQA
jgi:hypothetical protein